jgi:hypothetical protein
MMILPNETGLEGTNMKRTLGSTAETTSDLAAPQEKSLSSRACKEEVGSVLTRSLLVACGLTVALQLCLSGRVLGQGVDVFVRPPSQTVNAGDGLSVDVRLNTNGLGVCHGGVFLQFDTTRLAFVGGTNNTTTWNADVFNVEPAERQPGIVSLNVGAGSTVNATDLLVSTLNFTATSPGSAALTLLFNAGAQETQFFASDCSTGLTTNRSNGSVMIVGGAVLLVGAANGTSVERYDGTTGQFLGFFSSGGPFVSGPSSIAIGPNGNLFMKGWSTSQSVLQYDGATGAFINTFAAPTGGPGSAIVFGPDGNLYGEGPNQEINRYSGTTGALLGVFVPTGSGGLTGPEGMRFGPDGNLYVRNVNFLTNTFNILRYNGTTGAFMDEFVTSASGGLRDGGDIMFGPDGNLYASDNDNGQNPVVRRYNGSTGAFIDNFATGFPAVGEPVTPWGLAFGPDGNLYVAFMTAGVSDGVLRFAGTTGAFIDVFAMTTNINPTYIVFTQVQNRPPDCSAAVATPDRLWPPNHKYAKVGIGGVTDPDDDPVTITIDGITQDEPLDSYGDGHTCPDGAGVGTGIALVRAERAMSRRNSRDGRVYHIAFTAEDGRGGACSGTVSVCVPPHRRAGATCVDEGPLFDATGPCE